MLVLVLVALATTAPLASLPASHPLSLRVAPSASIATRTPGNPSAEAARAPSAGGHRPVSVANDMPPSRAARALGHPFPKATREAARAAVSPAPLTPYPVWMALLSVAGAVAALLGLRRMTPATRGGAWALLSATAEQPKGKVGVLGGGCFGTAFAQLMARNGYEVKMWVRNERTRESINADHENPKYLPDCTLSPRVTACDTFAEAVEGAALVAVAIPTPFLRDTFIRNRDVLPRNVPIVLLSKGIENETLLTPIEILREELPGKYSKYICCVSGPSFAKEIAKGLPTNVTCASECEAVATQVQRMVSDRYFKVWRL